MKINKLAMVMFGGLMLCGCAVPQLPSQQAEQLTVAKAQREIKVGMTSAQVLQDLGYNLTESETKMGLLTASKERDATNGGQIAGAVLLAALMGARVPLDTTQKIHATVVSTKSKNNDGYLVRAKFARVVFNDMGGAKVEVIKDPEIYQEFFNKLSQSIFLTANDI